MSESRVSARARVQITIEVDAGSAWGRECSADQIFRQASIESVNRVIKAMEGKCSIVGKPFVIAVFAQESN